MLCATLLLAEPVAFKVVASLRKLAQLNYAEFGGSQLGKFATIYPRDDEQAVRLVVALDQATRGLRGPALPTDRPLTPGSLVYYRYGGFADRNLQTHAGQLLPAIVAPDGQLIHDRRANDFTPPDWAIDPFRAAGVASELPALHPLIGRRYLVMATLYSSARGTVARAVDITTPQRCILKRAGRDAVMLPDGRDARDRLRHEAALLRRLAPDPRFPRVFDLFEQDGDLILAMEDVQGDTLAERIDRFAWLGRYVATAQIVAWGRELAATLATLHAQQIVYRDLKSLNIIVTSDDRPRLLDFGIAHDLCAANAPFGARNKNASFVPAVRRHARRAGQYRMAITYARAGGAARRHALRGCAACCEWRRARLGQRRADTRSPAHARPLQWRRRRCPRAGRAGRCARSAGRPSGAQRKRTPPRCRAAIGWTAGAGVLHRRGGYRRGAVVRRSLARRRCADQRRSRARARDRCAAAGRARSDGRSGGRLRFHLLLWDALGDDAQLQAALACGDALLAAAEEAGPGELCWRTPEGYAESSGKVYLGYDHGAAGIGDALLDLFEATAEPRFRAAAQSAGRWLSRMSVPALDDESGLTWPRCEDDPAMQGFWRHGAMGIGRFFLHAAALGALPHAAETAERAARIVARGTRAAGPTQCHGLAGSIEFLLDMFQMTGDARYLNEARSLAQLLETFLAERDGRLVWSERAPEPLTRQPALRSLPYCRFFERFSLIGRAAV